MAIRPHGAGYQVDVTVKGRRAPRLTYPTLSEARAAEARIKADLLEGKQIARTGDGSPRRGPATLELLGDLFEHTYRTIWANTKNARNAWTNGHGWVEVFGERCAVASLTTASIGAQCDAWAEAGNAPGTINRKLAALRKMLAVAHEEGVIPRIPRMPKRKEYTGRIRYFSDEEVASMLDFFTDEMRDLVILALDTGFRQGELLGLQPVDYSAVTNRLHLWETKADAPRAVPLTERAREVVVRRSAGVHLFPEPLTSSRISEEMRKWRESVGLDDDREAVFHALRHTCCSRLIQSGVGLVTVQKWMGHKTIETTLRYAHLAPNAFDEALTALNNWR